MAAWGDDTIADTDPNAQFASSAKVNTIFGDDGNDKLAEPSNSGGVVYGGGGEDLLDGTVGT